VGLNLDYARYSLDFASRVCFLNRTDDNGIMQEMLKLVETKCAQCQSDRLTCSIKPDCENRNLLNMMIDIGMKHEHLPKYCYSQHMTEIKAFIDGHGMSVNDKRIYIKDLFKLVKVRSMREFINFAKNKWDDYFMVRKAKYLLISANDLLIEFNFIKGIAIVNPTNSVISTIDQFELYLESFKKIYAIDYVLSYPIRNWGILKFEIPHLIDRSIYFEKLGELFKYVEIQNSESKSYVIIEVFEDNDSHWGINMPIRSLRTLFSLISDEIKEGEK